MEMKEQQSAPEASHPEHTAAPLAEEAGGVPANGAEEDMLAALQTSRPRRFKNSCLSNAARPRNT